MGNHGNSFLSYKITDTPFDLSNATFSKFFDLSNEEEDPEGITFNNDGTKMFISGDDVNPNIYEYTLSVPFDLDSAIFSNKTLDVSPEESFVKTGLIFNDDGSKLLFAGNNSRIYTYNLSTPFDLDFATFSHSFITTSQDSFPAGIAFNNDGTKFYFLGDQNDRIYEYNLGTPYDTNTAIFFQFIDISAVELFHRGIAFNNDGSKIFVVGNTTNSVHEYHLGTPFSIITAVLAFTFDISSQGFIFNDIAWNDDGTLMYVMDGPGKRVLVYDV